MIATIQRGSRFKTALEGMKGGVVKIMGPGSGHYSLRENVKSLLFIPYGVGISVMRSMIKYIFDKCLDIRSMLIHIDEDGHFLFRREIEYMAGSKTNISVSFTTRIPDPGEIRSVIERLESPFIYVSGPPHGVRGIVNILRASGVRMSRDSIAIEAFEGYEKPPDRG